MNVQALPALADNYLFVLLDDAGAHAALVDPAEAAPALEFLERRGLELTALLLTHHHRDHVGGVEALVRRHPAVRVIGAARDRHRLPRVTEWVQEGDVVKLLGREARVLEVAGHTTGHVAYFFPEPPDGGELFSGDTVFGATIGNLFEGTPDDMFHALEKIRALPSATRLWCGHEYTLQYVREAARFDPHNPRLTERLARLEAAGAGACTLPLALAEERATNPFFQWDDPRLAQRLGTPPGIETFRKLCDVL
jgi:hydroxyacylglutathione hydrolase